MKSRLSLEDQIINALKSDNKADINIVASKLPNVSFNCCEGDFSILHYAAGNNMSKLIEYLMQSDYKKHIDLPDDNVRTPLHIATTYGNKDMVSLLIEHGARIDIPDKNGNLPAHIAIDLGYDSLLDIVFSTDTALRKRIANYQNYNDKTPLHIHFGDQPSSSDDYALVEEGDQVKSRQKYYECVRKLANKSIIDFSILDNEGKSLPHKAIMDGDLTLLKVLLGKKCKNTKYFVNNSEGNNILHEAIIEKKLDITKWIIDQCINDHSKFFMDLLNSKNYQGRIPLVESIKSGNFEIFKNFKNTNINKPVASCDLNADKRLNDFYGSKPIHWATYSGNIKILSFILDPSGEHTKTSKILSQRSHLGKAHLDKYGNNPLHYLAANASNIALKTQKKIVDLLSGYSFDSIFMEKNSNNETPIDILIKNYNWQESPIIIEQSYYLGIPNGVNIFLWGRENPEGIYQLIKEKHNYLIECAIKGHNLEFIKSLYLIDYYKEESLLYAAEFGNLEIFNFFLENFPYSINIVDPTTGQNLLHKTAINGDEKMIEAILNNPQFTYNIYNEDSFKQTPLHLVAGNKTLTNKIKNYLWETAEITQKQSSLLSWEINNNEYNIEVTIKYQAGYWKLGSRFRKDEYYEFHPNNFLSGEEYQVFLAGVKYKITFPDVQAINNTDNVQAKFEENSEELTLNIGENKLIVKRSLLPNSYIQIQENDSSEKEIKKHSAAIFQYNIGKNSYNIKAPKLIAFPDKIICLTDNTNTTPFHRAIESNNIDLVLLLLKNGTKLLNDDFGYKSLSIAARCGHLELFQLLFDQFTKEQKKLLKKKESEREQKTGIWAAVKNNTDLEKSLNFSMIAQKNELDPEKNHKFSEIFNEVITSGNKDLYHYCTDILNFNITTKTIEQAIINNANSEVIWDLLTRNHFELPELNERLIDSISCMQNTKLLEFFINRYNLLDNNHHILCQMIESDNLLMVENIIKYSKNTGKYDLINQTNNNNQTPISVLFDRLLNHLKSFSKEINDISSSTKILQSIKLLEIFKNNGADISKGSNIALHNLLSNLQTYISVLGEKSSGSLLDKILDKKSINIQKEHGQTSIHLLMKTIYLHGSDYLVRKYIISKIYQKDTCKFFVKDDNGDTPLDLLEPALLASEIDTYLNQIIYRKTDINNVTKRLSEDRMKLCFLIKTNDTYHVTKLAQKIYTNHIELYYTFEKIVNPKNIVNLYEQYFVSLIENDADLDHTENLLQYIKSTSLIKYARIIKAAQMADFIFAKTEPSKDFKESTQIFENMAKHEPYDYIDTIHKRLISKQTRSDITYKVPEKLISTYRQILDGYLCYGDYLYNKLFNKENKINAIDIIPIYDKRNDPRPEISDSLESIDLNSGAQESNYVLRLLGNDLSSESDSY